MLVRIVSICGASDWLCNAPKVFISFSSFNIGPRRHVDTPYVHCDHCYWYSHDKLGKSPVSDEEDHASKDALANSTERLTQTRRIGTFCHSDPFSCCVEGTCGNVKQLNMTGWLTNHWLSSVISCSVLHFIIEHSLFEMDITLPNTMQLIRNPPNAIPTKNWDAIYK